MSARFIIVLALVALFAVEANSSPFGVKGGQNYFSQQSAKGSYSTQQQWQQPSKYFGQPTYKQEPVMAQQSQTSFSAPASVETGPVQIEAAPLKGQSSPVYQQEQRVEAAPTATVQMTQSIASPVQGQTTYQNEQRPEAAPLVGQSVAQPVASAQLSELSPAKGQSLSSAPVEAGLVQGQAQYQPEQHLEVAPVSKSSQLQASAQHYDAAPLKGQASYQQAKQPPRMPLLPAPTKLSAPLRSHRTVPVRGAPVKRAPHQLRL